MKPSSTSSNAIDPAKREQPFRDSSQSGILVFAGIDDAPSLSHDRGNRQTIRGAPRKQLPQGFIFFEAMTDAVPHMARLEVAGLGCPQSNLG